MKRNSYRYRLAKARKRDIQTRLWYRLYQEFIRVIEKPNS